MTTLGVRPSRVHRLLQGLSLGYVNSAVATVVRLVVTPIMLSSLGDAEYGLRATLLSLTTYLTLFDFGLSNATARFTAETNEESSGTSPGEALSSFVAMYAIIAGLMLFASIAVSPLLGSLLRLSTDLSGLAVPVFVLMGLSTSVSFLRQAASGWLFGREHYGAMAGVALFASVLNPLVTVLALILGASLLGLVAANTATVVVVTSLYYAVARRIDSHFQIQWALVDWQLIRRAVSFSTFAVFVALASRLIGSADNIVISRYVGTSAVAGYSIAAMLLNLGVVLIFRIGDILLPSYVRLKRRQDLARLRLAYLESSRIQVVLLGIFCVILVRYGELITRIWLGRSDVVSFPILLALAIYWVMHGFVHPVLPLVMGIGREGHLRAVALSYCLEAGIKLTVSLMLVSTLGPLGVAIGTVVGHAVSSFVILPWLACQSLGVSLQYYYTFIGKAALWGSVPALGAVFVTRFGWLAHPAWYSSLMGAFMVTVVYMASVWRFGFDSTGRRRYWSQLSRLSAGLVTRHRDLT